MSDDQLIQALRGLERPVDADPGFAEALFGDLMDLRAEGQRRRPSSMLLVAAALLVALAIGTAAAIGSRVVDLPWESSRDRPITDPDATPPVAAEHDWPGALRPEPGVGSLEVARYTNERNGQPGGDLIFDDPVADLGVPAADHVDLRVVHVQTDLGDPFGYFAVSLMLQAAYPDDLREPVRHRAAYGLVLETNGDGVPDYRLGIENVPGGRYRLWLTDLATEETRAGLFGDGLGGDRRGDGYPFGDAIHPGEGQDQGDDRRRRAWVLVGPDHIGVERQLFADGRVHFYAWASLIEDGRIVATDYAPDRGWLRVAP